MILEQLDIHGLKDADENLASLLAGATSSSLVLTDLELSDAGLYYCRITDAKGGDLTSNGAGLVVLDGLPLEIVTHPDGALKYLDESHTFSVAAINGIAPLTYQWSQDWTEVSGAINADLVRNPIVLSDAGVYRCRVLDATGAGWTWFHDHAYQLTPGIMTWQQAEDWAIAVGGHLVTINDQDENDFLQSFIGGASTWIGYGNFAMDGNWVWADGQSPGFTNFGDGEPNYAGGIECVAHLRGDGKWNDMPAATLLAGVVEKNDAGCVSNEATLTVADGWRLEIVRQPHGAWIEQGDYYTFCVQSIHGAGPVAYQWRFNGEPIMGATLECYTVDSAILDDSGDYDCLVSDGYATLTSSTAILRVVDGDLPLSGLYGLGVLAALLAMAGAYRQRRQA